MKKKIILGVILTIIVIISVCIAMHKVNNKSDRKVYFLSLYI